MRKIRHAKWQKSAGRAGQKTRLLNKAACAFVCLTFICGMTPSAAWADEQTPTEEAALFSPVACRPWNWWPCHKH